MLNKKVLILGAVLLLCSILAIGCGGGGNTRPPELTVDDLDLDNAYVVGDTFAASDADNYWGPYSDPVAFVLENGALVFDTSIAGGWLTLNFKDDALAADAYKYVVISVKVDSADNAADAEGAHFKFGDKGCSLADWGITGLNTSYKTFILDLAANGFTSWGTPPAPDFAINQVDATTAKISIDYIKLANKK